MSKAVVAVNTVQIVDTIPDIVGVAFACDSVGPYCFINLERVLDPDPDDVRYAAGEASLDLDLNSLAHVDCAPGVVRSIRVSPGEIELQLNNDRDPALDNSGLGDLQTIELHFDETPEQREQLKLAIQFIFDGTSVVPQFTD